MPEQTVPAFDPSARARIEDVAAQLLALCARLEERIATLEQQQSDTEDALAQLGMIKVPTA